MELGTILVALCSLLGTAVTTYSGFKLTSYRVEQLEKKVDKHNNFAERLPIVEEQIKVINHRLDDLSNGIDKLERSEAVGRNKN